MSESVAELFDVLFRGEIEAGQNIDQVKKRVGAIFKLDKAKVERLFSGQTPILNAIQTLPVPIKFSMRWSMLAPWLKLSQVLTSRKVSQWRH
ncbi:MAG: hypothetical protein P8M77_07935 [Porticoccaceae bacterium]|jgi:hypothetical protein|nr:hypothetical protein [Porticoccaceae bacterium]